MKSRYTRVIGGSQVGEAAEHNRVQQSLHHLLRSSFQCFNSHLASVVEALTPTFDDTLASGLLS